MNDTPDLSVNNLNWLPRPEADTTAQQTVSPAPQTALSRELAGPIETVGTSENPAKSIRVSSWQKLKNVISALFQRTQKTAFPAANESPLNSTPSEKPKGNAFTRIFTPEHPEAISEESLISNIITQNSEKPNAVEEHGDRHTIFGLKANEEAKEVLATEQEKKGKAEELGQLAKVILGSSLLIPFTSFLFSILFLSTSGPFSHLLENQNYGVVLAKKELALNQIVTDMSQKQQATADFAKKISDIQDNKVLQSIVTHRIDWKQVFETINDITDRAFEGNSISHYVTYTNYSGKSDTGTINIVGKVRDATGRSFAALVKLKDALNAYPNFDGVKISQFVKEAAQTGGKVVTSEYISPFSFQMQYLPTPADPATPAK